MREMKNCLASWHHSAHTAANARSSKVIDRRIRDARCVLIARTVSTREKNIKALSVLAAETRPENPVVLKVYAAMGTQRAREKDTSVIVLFRRERGQPAIVALLPKNGRHQRSRKFDRRLLRRRSEA